MRYVLMTPAATVIKFLSVLVHMGNVMPCQSEETVKQVKKSCERLNAHICERANFGRTILFLASPLTGRGVENYFAQRRTHAGREQKSFSNARRKFGAPENFGGKIF